MVRPNTIQIKLYPLIIDPMLNSNSIDFYNNLISTKEILRPLNSDYHTFEEDQRQIQTRRQIQNKRPQPQVQPQQRPQPQVQQSQQQQPQPQVQPQQVLSQPVNKQQVLPALLMQQPATLSISNLKCAEDENLCFTNNSTDKYSDLNPYSELGFQYIGVYYYTLMHYYESRIFVNDKNVQNLILQADTPQEAEKIANDNNQNGILYNRAMNNADGEESHEVTMIAVDNIKKAIMYEGLVARFKTHNNLLAKLRGTGDKDLIYHTNDDFWGDNIDGSGKNEFGKLLISIRSYIKNNPINKISPKLPTGGNKSNQNTIDELLMLVKKYNKNKFQKQIEPMNQYGSNGYGQNEPTDITMSITDYIYNESQKTASVGRR